MTAREQTGVRRARRRMVRGDVVDLAAAASIHLYVGIARDDETFELIDAVEGFFSVAGLPLGLELDEDAWGMLIHPDDRVRYDEAFAFPRLVAGPCACTYRVVLPDGRQLDLVERIAPRERLPDGGLRCAGMIIDVTRERRAERRAQTTAEALGVSFWEVELTADGRWRGVGETAKERALDPRLAGLIGGAPPAGPPDETWLGLIHPDDRHLWQEAFLRTHAVGDRIAVEYRVVGVDGHSHVAFESGIVRSVSPDGTALIDGVVFDVTERRAVADARRMAEDRLDRITSALRAYTYEGFLHPDGSYREVGDPEAAARFLGVPPPPVERLEEVWVERIHPNDRALYLGWEATTGEGTGFLEYRMVHGDGHTMTVAEWTSTRLLEDGVRYFEGVVLDVTDASETRERAEALELRLHELLANVDVLVATFAVVADGAREEIFRGPGTEALLGAAAAAAPDLVRAVVAIAVDATAGALLESAFARSASGADVEERVRVRTDAGLRVVQLRLHPRSTRDDGLEVDCVLADVTAEEAAAMALAQARDDAERRLRTDYLTGVASRAFAVAELERLLARPGARVAAALLDIDHFKKVNDIHLHAGGDAVLRAVAGRLAAGHGGLVARFGGEEFLVVREVVQGTDPRRGIDLLRRSVGAQPIAVPGDEQVRVTLSGGFALAEHGASAESVLAAVDRALHAAKRRGRDQLVEDVEVEPEELLADDPEVLRLAEAMSRAVGEHEGESELHCSRVSKLAGDVAAELGLDASQRLRCRAAGLVHDIGKIAVPRHILLRPGPLTPEERLVMQEHATMGAQIVAGIGLLADAAPAVRHHHERWDGTGYPDGIAGEAIPIEARIVAAVDAWSAMTEARLYRPALGHGDALAELERAAGSHLDAAVVRALVAVLARAEPVALDGAA